MKFTARAQRAADYRRGFEAATKAALAVIREVRAQRFILADSALDLARDRIAEMTPQDVRRRKK